jgi:acetate kinase
MENKKYLIVNTGSASKKYAFYKGEEKVYSAHFEMEGADLVVSENFGADNLKTILNTNDYPRAAAVVLESLIRNKVINVKEDVDLVGIRIVAPGEYFLTNRFIDAEYLAKAADALEKVPLHLGPALLEIENIKKSFGEAMPIAGVSDSAFHATIPEHAKFYAIPIADSRRLGLCRVGYHGISVQSVVSKAKETLGSLPEKVVVCHLGGGASVTAVKNGQSIDTSMGFTPLEGLVMATRVGDLDPGAVLYLSEKLNKDYRELGQYFNNECGLLGLSGKSSDIRELLTNEQAGDADSTLALKVYVHRLKQYIGKMAAVLGGVDLLILAGTVGERSFIMRQRVCEGLEYLGLELDEEFNNTLVGIDAEISKTNSKSKILVIKTDEMEEIAKVTNNL